MKKIVVLLLCVLMLGGCKKMDYNTMVCSLEGYRQTYDIQYKEGKVIALYLVENRDLSGLNEVEVENIADYARKVSKERNKVKGVQEQVVQDESILITRIKVDFKQYDIEEDSLHLFFVPLTKGDLDSITSVRKALTDKGMQCDKIVSKKYN